MYMKGAWMPAHPGGRGLATGAVGEGEHFGGVSYVAGPVPSLTRVGWPGDAA